MDNASSLVEWSDWTVWKTITLQRHKEHSEIGLLTLNRPDKLNALNADMINDLNECLDLLRHAFDCRVLIMTGAGKIFCPGIDFSEVSATHAAVYEWEQFQDPVKKQWERLNEISSIVVKLRKIPQPIIVAAHGAAAGTGMALVNAADLVFASKETRFINAFIRIGISGAESGSSYFLPRTVGFHRSNELLYSGRDFHAEEAYQWGYVNRLVEKSIDVVKEAVKFAAEMLLTKSPLGLRYTKEAININIGLSGLDEVMGFESRTQALIGESKDFQEGIKAFLEKRNPKYNTR